MSGQPATVAPTAAEAPTPVAIAPSWVGQAASNLEGAPASHIVAWAVETFGPRISVATSFTDTVLVHLATRVAPDLEVIFLDTGFHFAETLQTMRDAHTRYQLNLNVVRPAPDAADVWNHGAQACCDARKVGSLRSALSDQNKAAWLSGVRRADGPTRRQSQAVEVDSSGLIKVNPLVEWSDLDVASYVQRHQLVANPLTEQGYPSIGCWPCTEPATDADPRAGRWSGSTKTECGLHL